MKLPNSYGSITKLSGNRRKPWMVRLSGETIVNEQSKTAYKKRIVLGYYETKKDAIQALADYNRRPFEISKEKITARDIWGIIENTISVSDDRKARYAVALRLYCGAIMDIPIRSVKTSQIQNILDSIDKGYSTQSIVRAVLNQIYDYAIQNNLCDFNPVQYVHLKPKKTEIKREMYTAEEIKELWKVDDEDYRLTLVLLYEGARIKEIREMKKCNVDLEKETLKIVEAKNETSVREIPIHPKVKPIIEKQMETTGDLLFHMNKNHYDRFARNVLCHHAYDTRHTFATRANELGLDKLIIQRIMGHKPETVLEQTYIHLKMELIRETLCKLKY